MTLDDIRESLRIEEVEEALGLEVEEKRGKEHICFCPLPSHGGRDSHAGNFSFNTDKLVYNCFSCGGGGSLTTLVMELRGTDHDESLEWLVGFSDFAVFVDDNRFAKEIDRLLNSQKEPERDERNPTLPWFPRKELDDFKARIEMVDDWLISRNITPAIWEDYSLGFTPAYSSSDSIYPALIVPHFFEQELRGWQARYMGKEPRPKGIEKYKSTRQFPKHDTLYNFDRNYSSNTALLVVESPLTVCTLASYGIDAVATFGAGMPDPKKGNINRQMKLLQNMNRPLILSFDNDPAGKTAIKRLIAHLAEHVSIEIVPPIEGEKSDLGDLPKEEVLQYISAREPSFLWDI